MIYALIAALGWGAAAGHFHAPYWVIVVGALISTALGFWLERERLTRSAGDNRRNLYLMMAAAYVFVSVIAVGLVGLTYGVVVWLHR